MPIEFDASEGFIFGPYQSLPEGIYPFKVTAAEIKENEKSGKTNLELKVRVTSGEHEGVTRTKSQGLDFSKKGNVGGMCTVLSCLGFDEKKFLGNAKVKVDEKKLVGREGYFYTRPKDPAAGEQYDPFDWIPAGSVQEMKDRFASANVPADTEAAPVVKAPKNGAASKAASVPQPPADSDDGDVLDLG